MERRGKIGFECWKEEDGKMKDGGGDCKQILETAEDMYIQK